MDRKASRRILIDTLGAPEGSGGMQLVVSEVLRAWIDEYPDDDIVVVGASWVAPLLPRSWKFFAWPNISPISRIFGQMVVVPLVYLLSGSRSLLAMNCVCSPMLYSRATLLSHDWRHLRNPFEFSRVQLFYRKIWALSARRARNLACVSEKTRLESANLVGRADAVTVESGRDHPGRWHVPAVPESVELQPLRKFALTYGHWTNKRPELVIEAFALTRAHTSIYLVVLGAQGEYVDGLREIARALGCLDRCVFPGFVGTDDYAWLIANCSLIILASSDEGFGLPVVEGQFFGIPSVVTADSGLGQVFGGEIVISEPNAEDLAREIDATLAVPVVASTPSAIRTWRDMTAELRNIVVA